MGRFVRTYATRNALIKAKLLQGKMPSNSSQIRNQQKLLLAANKPKVNINIAAEVLKSKHEEKRSLLKRVWPLALIPLFFLAFYRKTHPQKELILDDLLLPDVATENVKKDSESAFYQKSLTSFTANKELVKSFISDTFKDLEKEGVSYIENIFKAKDTHEASLVLLKNVLKDPRFVEESKTFGLDLILHVINTPECKKDVQDMILDVVKHEDVKKETVEILKYVTQQQESKEILADYFKVIFLREDMMESLSATISKAAYTGLLLPETKARFGQFVLNVVGNEEVQNGVVNALIMPIKAFLYDTFTFSFYNKGSGSPVAAKSDQEQKSSASSGKTEEAPIAKELNDIIKEEIGEYTSFLDQRKRQTKNSHP